MTTLHRKYLAFGPAINIVQLCGLFEVACVRSVETFRPSTDANALENSMNNHRFHDLPVLVDRLSSGATKEHKKVIFLVGSPLAAPELPGNRGVPGVGAMIDLIRESLRGPGIASSSLEAALQSCKSPYQAAFEVLQSHRGQDAVNEIIQRAVLQARTDREEGLPRPLRESRLEELENDVEGWTLPAGVRTLGKLVATHPSIFGHKILTCNFDPLIEISVKRSGGTFYRSVFHNDGSLSQTSADGCHVVHFHGYWRGHDTLHTPGQLLQARPKLKQALARLLESSTVVVLGYGAWDDIFTAALVDVVIDESARPDILWAFREAEEPKLDQHWGDLLNKLSPAIGRGRVTLFKGIDCNTFLPRLLQELTDERVTSVVSHGANISSKLVEVTDVGSTQPRLELRIQLPIGDEDLKDTDSPPQNEYWVGRDTELQLLEADVASTVVISGIGGQGKSALAARYLRRQMADGAFERWDWRDCKEEGDRIGTQLMRIILRVSGGRIDLGSLETADSSALVAILFNVLGTQRWLFVFDNVDYYMNLETGEFAYGLGKLFDAANARDHRSRFIFTCRPGSKSESLKCLRLPLEGLSEKESAELFSKCGIRGDDLQSVKDAHDLTNGHPMWMSMLAMQVKRMQRSLAEIVREIRNGTGELPEKTLRSIWSSLNNNQQALLRTLAEVERPQPEHRLEEMVEGIPWNRIARSVKTLRSLQLIVVRRQEEVELLELHPLVKAFVRKEFPRQDREQYISKIVLFLEKMMGKYKSLLDKRPPFLILDHWMQKIELDLNRGRHEDAVLSLTEVAGPLTESGFYEELVRMGKRLLNEIDWAVACVEYKSFDQLLIVVIESMTQLGQYTDAERYLANYETAIPGKSAQYINLCALRCYCYWYRQEFAQAIMWGEEGDVLRATSNVDTSFFSAHNLALARRDSGQIEPALRYFLAGSDLVSVVSDKTTEKGRPGNFYGNIGRCLHFQGKLQDAVAVYRKSASLLEEDQGRLADLNRGYIRFWIGEAQESLGEKELAASCFAAAIRKWDRVSPPRARAAETSLSRVMSDGYNPAGAIANDADEAERRFRTWLNCQ